MKNKELKFKVGQIYKMAVAHSSHVLEPYYVEIIEVSKNSIVTNIPGKHSLRISRYSNWNYHIPRMTYMGMKATHGHLIYNQNIVHKKTNVMKCSLLVCIAFHYSPERLIYLERVIGNLLNKYGSDIIIVIDTNYNYLTGIFDAKKVKIFEHKDLQHPFHLTWCHRKHIKESIDNFENFMYIEDDMLLSFENYISYLETFKLLWPKYVPSFIRIEKKDGKEYVSDVPARQNINELGILEIEGRSFVALPFPINYHAFWIMPQKELKENMKADFVRVSDGREFAAMYTGWELQKTSLIEVRKTDTGYEVSPKCYSYHLPNNYALSEGHPNGKILTSEIFI